MSRLKTVQKQMEIDIANMRFFCLNPSYENFKSINNNKTLIMREGESYRIWYDTVLGLYGDRWGLDTANIDIGKMIGSLQAKMLLRPTKSLLEQTWAVFFASGNIDILSMAFEVGGNARASKILREDAVRMFTTVRDEYQSYAALDEHVSSANGVFNRFQVILDQKTKELEKNDYDDVTAADIINKLATSTPPKPNIEEPIDEKEIKSNEKKKKIEKASKLYDSIATDIFSRI
jgi:hypothetical protein